MNRRRFLAAAALGSAGVAPIVGQNYSDYSRDPRPDVTEGTFTAGSAPGPVLAGPALIAGPSNDALTFLQPVQRAATGYLEYAAGDDPFQRVETEEAGMLPFAGHVLKFRFPPLPPGRLVRCRCVAWTAGWVKVRQFYHGELRAGDPAAGPVQTFRTLDPAAATTAFAVWNDTHENAETLRTLQSQTEELKPDFLVWNGDQSNDVHFERDMAAQFIAPVASRWPLAYVRGNHDVRGPAARSLADFTGTPGDRFYYAFRSGPVAALVMDTGEDKPDDSPQFAGMAAFQRMQRRQAEWLGAVTRERWFREAPHKILFCHIPLWFTRDIFPAQRRWEAHDACRKLWLPGLLEAGVKLVVSGHTHSPRWMPARDGHPISQLIGGGPAPGTATLIECAAERAALRFKMRRLDGTVVAEAALTG